MSGLNQHAWLCCVPFGVPSLDQLLSLNPSPSLSSPLGQRELTPPHLAPPNLAPFKNTGLPLGLISTISGEVGSAKTALALHWAAQCHTLGGQVAWVDLDGGISSSSLSLYPQLSSSMMIARPPTLLALSSMLCHLIHSALFSLIIIDSSPLSECELSGTTHSSPLSSEARHFLRDLPLLSRLCAQHGVGLLLTELLRTSQQRPHLKHSLERSLFKRKVRGAKRFSSVQLEIDSTRWAHTQSSERDSERNSVEMTLQIRLSLHYHRLKPPL